MVRLEAPAPAQSAEPTVNHQPTQRPLLAKPDVAHINAWNARARSLLKDLVPIAERILVRAEFSGACTAEEAVSAAASIFNSCALTGNKLEVDIQSSADWSPAAQHMAMLNHPGSCRFRDIMNLAPKSLRTKLQGELEEKAPQIFAPTFLVDFFWQCLTQARVTANHMCILTNCIIY